MKTNTTTPPTKPETGSYPVLARNTNNLDVAVFHSPKAGTWLSGSYCGEHIAREESVYFSQDWEILPIGVSITLTQE